MITCLLRIRYIRQKVFIKPAVLCIIHFFLNMRFYKILLAAVSAQKRKE